MTLTPVAPATTAPLTSASVLELPAQLLLAAAQFASKDTTKPKIALIQITATDAGATIRSTDSYRAFRCYIPSALIDHDQPLPADGLELQIPAEALRKACAKAQVAVITADFIRLLDKKRECIELRAASCAATQEFPDVDAVWPEQFSYDPGRALGFDAAYMESICTIAKRLSANGNVALRFNASHTAFALTAGCAIEHAGQEHSVDLEFLLMPVQMRDNAPVAELEQLIKGFNGKPAEQREDIKLKLKGGTGWLGGAYGVQFFRDGKLLYTANTLAEARGICRWIAGATD